MKAIFRVFLFSLCATLSIFWPAHASAQYPGAHAKAGTVTTFDVPGCTSTNPTAINPDGAITGYYSDVSFVTHGFLRAPDGTITTFPRAR